MLNPASLNLDSYFYSCINVSLDMEAYFGEEISPLTTADLNADFFVKEDFDSDEDLIVTLEVSTEASDKKNPLNIEIKVMGRFLANDELRARVKSGDVKRENVVINGLSILYSSIRDQVLSLTAKMPIGPVFLPTCTFSVKRNEPIKEELPVTKKVRRRTKIKPV